MALFKLLIWQANVIFSKYSSRVAILSIEQRHF